MLKVGTPEAIDYGVKLDELISKSNSHLAHFREDYKRSYEFFVGDFYSQKADDPIFLNKLQQGVMIFSRCLASRAPRSLIKSDTPELRPIASSYQRVLNRDSRGMELELELQRMIIDALFFVGIGKVGLCSSDEIKSVDDTRFDPGKPFISRVSPDDFFFDTNATKRESVQFIGDIVEIDKKLVEESGCYGTPEEVKTWIGTTLEGVGKNSGVHSLSGGLRTDPRLYPTVLMREIYLPRERAIVSMPVGSSKIVRVEKWRGPKSGPYELLSFVEVPDNVVPLSIVQGWYRLAVLINDLMVKISKQGNRQKKILLVSSDSTKDADKIRNAKDGECVVITRKGSSGINGVCDEASLGGIDAQNFTFLQACINLFNEMAGNLSLLGGLSPQSSTLGQDEILSDRASAMEADMKSRTVSFTKKLLEKYAFFHWSDPFNVLRGSASFAPIGEMLSALPPEVRNLGFDQLGLEIIPYSMEYRSPKNERGEYLESTNILNGYLVQNGYQLNVQEFVKGLEQRGNIDDLHRLIQPKEQPAMQGNGSTLRYESNASPSTSHTENRVSTMNNQSAGLGFSQAMQQAAQQNQRRQSA